MSNRASSGRRRRSALQERLSQRIPAWYHPVTHFLFNVGAAVAMIGVLAWHGTHVVFRPGALVAVPLALLFGASNLTTPRCWRPAWPRKAVNFVRRGPRCTVRYSVVNTHPYR